MQAPELTLDAALRDSTSTRIEARAKAVRNLAPALLAELGRPSPAWQTSRDHPRGGEVAEALHRALVDDDPMVQGLAAVGLGLLGDPSVLDAVEAWIERDGEAHDVVFRRETAIIAISLVGAAAPPPEAAFRQAARDRLDRALDSSLPDVRFQAAVALVEVGGEAVEERLVEALIREEHPDVRENLVVALSKLDPPGPAACDVLESIVADADEGPAPIGFEAALVLAAARRSTGGPRLVQGLRRRAERDRALEALAVLGRAAPPDAVERVHAIARSFFVPGVTRVRAAYALARMAAGRDAARNPGLALLRRLAWHPRPAVREAVADARAALRRLHDDETRPG